MQTITLSQVKYLVQKITKSFNLLSGTQLSLDLRKTSHVSILKELSRYKLNVITSLDITTNKQKGEYLNPHFFLEFYDIRIFRTSISNSV